MEEATANLVRELLCTASGKCHMHITKLLISNFKSYRQTAPVLLGPGFNVIVGQNSAGKSALIECLRPGGTRTVPHRSPETIPVEGDPPTNQVCSIDVSFQASQDDVRRALRQATGNPPFQLVVPQLGSEIMVEAGCSDLSPGSIQRVVNRIFERPSFDFDFQKRWGEGIPHLWRPTRLPSMGLYPATEPNIGTVLVAHCALSEDGTPVVQGTATIGRQQLLELAPVVGPALMAKVFCFDAERYNIGRHPVGQNSSLNPNASNLPEALSVLNANPVRFRKYNELVRHVLPQVRQISVRPAPNSHVEILVWPFDRDRVDLAVPLNDCGTGVSQVLATLYIAACSPHPLTIAIDEPQSFLHPGAIRRLVEILKMYPQHQYIIATHSPQLIAWTRPTTLTIARLSEGMTEISQMDPGDVSSLQASLSEVGARLSDVFGADNILWVEGRTEESCFPVIVEKVLKQPLPGTAVLGVKHTSDFEGRDVESVLEIYRKLSQASQLLPPAIGFIFDRECREDRQIADILRAAGRSVKFTPRRMFENYLLNADAVAVVMNSIAGFRNTTIEPDEVRGWLDAHLGDAKYYCRKNTPQERSRFLIEASGAGVLDDLFAAFSEPRVYYDKVKHGLALTEWIAANTPNDLNEVAELIGSILA